METLSCMWSDQLADAIKRKVTEPLKISFGTDGEEYQAFQRAVNQGIDSHLEAIRLTQDGRSFAIAIESVGVLIRRLLESDDEVSIDLGTTACYALGIELILLKYLAQFSMYPYLLVDIPGCLKQVILQIAIGMVFELNKDAMDRIPARKWFTDIVFETYLSLVRLQDANVESRTAKAVSDNCEEYIGTPFNLRSDEDCVRFTLNCLTQEGLVTLETNTKGQRCYSTTQSGMALFNKESSQRLSKC